MIKTRRLLAGLLSIALIFADVMSTGLVAQAAEVSQQASVEMEGGNVTVHEEEDSTHSEGASDEEDGEPESSEDQKDDGNGDPEFSENHKDTEDGEIGEEEAETPEEENPNEGTEAPEIAAVLSTDETIIAQGTYTKNGSNTKWVIDGNGKLTVTGTGEVKDSGAYAPWYYNAFEFKNDIKTAVIEVSGMKDASRLFYGCGGLTDLDLSSFDTGQVTNMSEMFFECSSLTDLDLRGLDTHSVTNMSGMFYECNGLTDLDLSGLDTHSVTDMSRMFFHCDNLTDLNLSGFDISSVTDMSEMFSQCSSLIDLDLSSFGKSSVLDVEKMFFSCQNLRKLDVSSFDTGSIKNMREMFYGCSRLKDLDVSGFDTGSVTDMRHMFYNCSSLTKLDLGSWNAGKVDYAEYMFYGCDSLGAINAPLYLTISVALPTGGSSEDWYREDSVETLTELPRNLEESVRLTKSREEVEHRGTYPEDPTDGSYTEWVIDGDGKLTVTGTGEVKAYGAKAPWYSYRSEIRTAVIEVKEMKDSSRLFYGCDKMDSVDLSGFDTSSVTDMRMMFYGCSDLRDLDLSKFNTASVTDMGGMFYGCSLLRDLDLSGFKTSQVADMGGMFYGCSNLRTLDLSGLDTSRVTDMNCMFYDCSNLRTLDLSGLNAGLVSNIKWMFSGCSSLTSLNLSGLDAHSVTNMGDIFDGCSSLTSVNLSGLDARSVTDMGGMFAGCSSLTTLDLSSLKIGSVTDMNHLLSGCSSLTTLDLNDLDTSSVADMNYMFDGCSSLIELDVSGLDTGSVTNMQGMFNGCSSLAELDLNGLDTSSVADMSGMFDGCSSLIDLDLSGFDTGSVTNMGFMFNGCSSLTNLDLSGFDTRSVDGMNGMFLRCSSLTKLDLRNWKMGKVDRADVMLDGCDSLELIYAPLNLPISVALPRNYGWWYEGTNDKRGVSELPRNLENSVLLVRLFDYPITIHGGIYTEGGSYIDWLIDKDGRLTVMGTGDVRVSGESVPWIKYSGDIKTAVIKVTGMKDASGLFKRCTNLESVDLSGFETDQVTDMSEMFYECGSLTTLDVSGFKTSLVTDMSRMFYNCRGLKSLDVSGLDTHSVTNMSEMFWHCENIITLDVSGFKTGSVTNMHGLFSGCNNLTELDVSGFDTHLVTDMNRVFDLCHSLPELDLRDWDMGKVTDTECMLLACYSLETIFAPLNLQTTVYLPTEKNSDVWYCGGKKLTELPMNLSTSVLLTKNKKAEAGGIYAKKGKTSYLCGETVEIGDLAVIYQRSDGSIKELAAGEYQTPNISDINNDTNTPGKKELKITYTNPDGAEFSTTVELTFCIELTEGNTTVILPEKNLVYNGYPQTPEPTVTIMIDGTSRALAAGVDYTVAYTNNINAGENAVITIEGIGYYSGTAKTTFTIDRAKLIILAEDITLAVGDGMPEDKKFLHEAVGLIAGDEEQLIVTAFFTRQGSEETVSREGVNTYEEGIYAVTLQTDAGNNYEVTESRAGKLIIAAERVIYTIIFDLMGHGKNVEIPGIKAGSLLDIDELAKQSADAIPREKDGEPVPDESGRYVFAGWYKDKTFETKTKWDFDTDTVQADTTLYACWLEKASEDGSGLQLSIQDIRIQYYTGNAIKPTVYVYAADGVTPLKSGKDYTIKYANNTNAIVEKDEKGEFKSGGTAFVTNPGKRDEVLNNISGSFDKDLPYIIITGKGNYQNTIYKNFQILPASISAGEGSGSKTPASGFTLKYSDQLVTNEKKDQNPFNSLKYKKAMKLGTDYEIILTAGDDVQRVENAAEAAWVKAGGSAGTTGDGKATKYAAPVIPKGYYGTFTMTVTGKGNYSGSFEKKVIVMDKDHLMRNAKISLGKNQKSMPYTDEKAATLTPGYMVVNGKTKEYYEAGNPENLGNANDIFMVSVKDGKVTKYLRADEDDFTVSYTNNKAVGTATMTITGNPEKGYYGSKSVTFKIIGTAFNAKNIEISTVDGDRTEGFRTSIPYTGKTITQNKVALTAKATDNVPPRELDYGTHYTISYKNNIKKGTATMTFKAKPESGYTGSFKKTFKITPVDIEDPKNIKIEAVKDGGHIFDSIEESIYTVYWGGSMVGYALKGTVAYTREGAKASAHIRLSLIDEEGDIPEAGIVLKEGTDYTVSYANNTEVISGKTPTMTIKGKGNFTGSLRVDFKISEAAMENNYNITANAASMTFNRTKPGDYEYRPKVTVKDGSKTLNAKNDYDVKYQNCTQKDIENYLEELASVKEWSEIQSKRPYAVITAKEGSGYTTTQGGIIADLNIYEEKLTSNTLYVVVSEENLGTTYTGKQVTPEVAVYYGEASKVKAAKKLDKETVLKSPDTYGLTLLKKKSDEGTDSTGDYTVTYGANIASGKNKGSVTITGSSMKYGGSVTVMFEIKKSDIYYAK